MSRSLALIISPLALVVPDMFAPLVNDKLGVVAAVHIPRPITVPSNIGEAYPL